jgi:hypothetical protein
MSDLHLFISSSRILKPLWKNSINLKAGPENMGNEVLEKNKKSLKQSHKRVYNKILEYEKGHYCPLNASVEKILLARNEELVVNMLIKIDGRDYTLIESDNPVEESYKWIEEYIKPSSGIDVIFGIGFGFHLEIMAKSFPNKKLVIIEPNMDLFYQIISVRNLTAVFDCSELYVDEDLNTSISNIKRLYWDTEKTELQCTPLIIYMKMFKTIWDELREKFLKSVQNFIVDVNTRRIHGEDWVENYITNLKKIKEASDASVLFKSFSGIPGILVSAGPSLEKHMKYIKKLKGKALIAAAGTAVNILERNGIIPHIMCGVDSGEVEASIHKKVKSNDIYMCYSNQISQGSLESYKGPKFLIDYSFDTYTKGFYKMAQICTQSFYSGPSVANTLFDIMYKAGCNPIILAGQDLSFKDEKVYAEKEHDYVIDINDRNKNKMYVEDYDVKGNTTYTKPDFVVMRNWFEEYFQHLLGKVKVINCAEEGLNIKYCDNMSFESLMEKYDFEDVDLPDILAKAFIKGKYDDKTDIKRKDYESFCINEIETILINAEKQNRYLTEIKKGLLKKTLDEKRFLYLNEEISQINEKLFASPVYDLILKHIIEIEIFIKKGEFERKIKNIEDQYIIFNYYKDYINSQNEFLKNRLSKVLDYLKA